MTCYAIITPSNGHYIRYSLADAESISKQHPGSSVRIFRYYDEANAYLSRRRMKSPSVRVTRALNDYLDIKFLSYESIIVTDSNDVSVPMTLNCDLNSRDSDDMKTLKGVVRCLELFDGKIHFSLFRNTGIFKTHPTVCQHSLLRSTIQTLNQRQCIVEN